VGGGLTTIKVRVEAQARLALYKCVEIAMLLETILPAIRYGFGHRVGYDGQVSGQRGSTPRLAIGGKGKPSRKYGAPYPDNEV
jgi:hypothetical protein